MSEELDVRRAIENVLNRILAQSGRRPRAFADTDMLTQTIGLDSLDIAVAVVQLEQELGADPFRHGTAPVPTFGEFVALYQKERAKQT